MMSTRLASSRSIAFSPNALTSVVMFFLVSGRDMARMAGLRGFFRNLKISCAPPWLSNQQTGLGWPACAGSSEI